MLLRPSGADFDFGIESLESTIYVSIKVTDHRNQFAIYPTAVYNVNSCNVSLLIYLLFVLWRNPAAPEKLQICCGRSCEGRAMIAGD